MCLCEQLLSVCLLRKPKVWVLHCLVSCVDTTLFFGRPGSASFRVGLVSGACVHVRASICVCVRACVCVYAHMRACVNVCQHTKMYAQQ